MDKNALVHFYRGELGRMTSYRIRLDTTSNWALAASIAVVTFALGDPDAPHVVIALPAMLTSVFALVEARRLKDLELSRLRVRLLEEGFFGPELGRPGPEDWASRLADSLAVPRSPLPLWRALAFRVRRAYLGLFIVLYAAWWLKLWMSGAPPLAAAAIGGIPGWLVIAVATLSLLPPLVLALLAKPLLPG